MPKCIPVRLAWELEFPKTERIELGCGDEKFSYAGPTSQSGYTHGILHCVRPGDYICLPVLNKWIGPMLVESVKRDGSRMDFRVVGTTFIEPKDFLDKKTMRLRWKLTELRQTADELQKQIASLERSSG